MTKPKKYCRKTRVSQRYDRTPRTIDRWITDPTSDFPRPIAINGILLWLEADLDAYDEKNNAKSYRREEPAHLARAHGRQSSAGAA